MRTWRESFGTLLRRGLPDPLGIPRPKLRLLRAAVSLLSLYTFISCFEQLHETNRLFSRSRAMSPCHDCIFVSTTNYWRFVPIPTQSLSFINFRNENSIFSLSAFLVGKDRRVFCFPRGKTLFCDCRTFSFPATTRAASFNYLAFIRRKLEKRMLP